MDDWETATKIGKSVRPGGGSSNPTVIRTAGGLNAAKRAGNVATEKKQFTTANTASGNTDGQRLTKVANTDDIVKFKTVSLEVARALADARVAAGFKNQKELANRSGVKASLIGQMEASKGNFAAPENGVYDLLEKHVGVHLRGANVGKPMGKKMFKRDIEAAAAAAAAAKKAPAAKTTIKIVPPGAKPATPSSATPKSATPKSAGGKVETPVEDDKAEGPEA